MLDHREGESPVSQRVGQFQPNIPTIDIDLPRPQGCAGAGITSPDNYQPAHAFRLSAPPGGPACASYPLTLLTVDQDHKIADPVCQLECDLLEGSGALPLRSLYRRRIDEAPMHFFGVAGKGRARFAHAITHGDDIVEGLAAKLVEVLVLTSTSELPTLLLLTP